MGTRSKIGILKSDGKIDAIYCHWDGYPSYNGRILIENYTEQDKIRKLISLGAISSLHETLDDVVSYYGWREEEQWKETFDNIKAYEKAYGELWDEYNYLFKDGKWYVFDGNYEYDGWKEVEEILKKEEDD